MRRIILASKSPRRLELMKLTKLPFEVIVSDANEDIKEALSPNEMVELLSKRKAMAIKENGIIIGADTVVAINSHILGKPDDEADAKRMLKLLSGNVHQVYTGVTLICDDIADTFSVKTDVEFFPLTDEEIDDYIKLGECLDKAGAYAIQGMGGLFVKEIIGDFNNVVGLPVSMVYRKLRKLI